QGPAPGGAAPSWGKPPCPWRRPAPRAPVYMPLRRSSAIHWGIALGVADERAQQARLVLQLAHPPVENVADADHADHAPMLLNGEVADGPRQHGGGHQRHAVPRGTDNHSLAHALGHRQAIQIGLVHGETESEVPFGNDTIGGGAIATDNGSANALLAQAFTQRRNAIRWLDGDDVGTLSRKNFRYGPGTTPM